MLLALELVQLSMARAPAPSNEHAASAAVDLLRMSLVQRTQYTQRCQLRAVTWRLQHERSVIMALESQLDNAADHILDLEDEREELLDIGSGAILTVACSLGASRRRLRVGAACSRTWTRARPPASGPR